MGGGVFERVGTPRPWLRPFIGLFAGAHALARGFHRGVAFSVVNRPEAEAAGASPAVRAVRSIHLPSGEWQMRDRISGAPGMIVDLVGDPVRIGVELEPHVIDGALRLDSTRSWLQLGRLRIAMPGWLRLVLLERIDAASGRQEVSITVTAPLIATVYEYAGRFSYEIREENRGPDA